MKYLLAITALVLAFSAGCEYTREQFRNCATDTECESLL